MLNQLVLVGRLVSDLQINETENESKECKQDKKKTTT